MHNLSDYITEYVSSGRGKKHTIVATNETIKQIVKDELDRLGHDADLNHIDVSQVTNMNGLFSCAIEDLGRKYADLNPDISKWVVSDVNDMSYMFYNCTNFNCDISSWDVSGVENMLAMFNGCESFNKDISGWKVNDVKYYNLIFNNCRIKEEYKPKFK